MKNIILMFIVLNTSIFAFGDQDPFANNPIKLTGECVGTHTKIVTLLVGVDPENSYGVFMRNNGAWGTESIPFTVIGQNGAIRVQTPDSSFSFAPITIKSGTTLYFSLTSRLDYDSAERDLFQCVVKFQ